MGKWFHSETEERGVVLVVHGLGNSPNVMDPIVTVLCDAGFHCLRFSVAGHEEDRSLKHSSSRERWLDDFLAAFKEIKNLYPNLPVYNVGFSLGGALSIDAIEHLNEISFSGVCYFAPAVSVRKYTGVVKYLFPLRHLGVSVPNLIPSEIAAGKSTSLHAHYSLFECIKAVETLSEDSLVQKTKGIVFFCKRDALVDHVALTHWVKKNNLNRLEMIEIKPPLSSHPSGHIFLSEEYAGKREWERIKKEILNLFN